MKVCFKEYSAQSAESTQSPNGAVERHTEENGWNASDAVELLDGVETPVDQQPEHSGRRVAPKQVSVPKYDVTKDLQTFPRVRAKLHLQDRLAKTRRILASIPDERFQPH